MQTIHYDWIAKRPWPWRVGCHVSSLMDPFGAINGPQDGSIPSPDDRS